MLRSRSLMRDKWAPYRQFEGFNFCVDQWRSPWHGRRRASIRESSTRQGKSQNGGCKRGNANAVGEFVSRVQVWRLRISFPTSIAPSYDSISPKLLNSRQTHANTHTRMRPHRIITWTIIVVENFNKHRRTFRCFNGIFLVYRVYTLVFH